jgi:competence protein ComEC
MLNPMDLFRPAFQYSFMAVLALLHLCPHVAKAIAVCFMKIRLRGVARSFDSTLYGALLETPDPRPLSTLGYFRSRLGFVVAQLAALAASAWFVTAPLSCYHFNTFTPMGWLQTLLLWFVAMPATLVGFITLFFGTLIPSSGLILGPILNALTNLMLALVQLLAAMPGTIVDGRSPSIWWLLAVYAALGIWVYRRRWMPWRYGFKVLVLVLVLWWWIPARWVRAEGDALQAWVLDVGDGTGTVIELPGGQVLVYDFGTRSPFDAGAVGAAFFRHRGIRHLDAVFVSHPNFDHYGGLETLAKDFTIGRVIINDQFERFAPQGSAARRFLNKIKNLGITIQVTSGRHQFEGLGDVEVEAIWPPAAEQQPVPDSNEGSTVLRITFQGRSILLTGDIAEFGMGMLLADGGLGADALLLPHHGGVVHNTGQFIAAVDPQVAVRSSRQRRALTTNEIETLLGDVQYFNTADDGCVLVRIKDGELVAEAGKFGP